MSAAVSMALLCVNLQSAPVIAATGLQPLFSRVLAADAGEYRAVVKNSEGEVSSAIATLTVDSSLAVVYDNTANSQDARYYPKSGVEVGDEIDLFGEPRRVTEFEFWYYLSSASGNEKGEVFFRKNDGGRVASAEVPGTILYRSGPFPLYPGYQIAFANELSVEVPGTFTWSVVFTGIEDEEQVALFLYSPPAIGDSYNDFWLNDGGWRLLGVTEKVANFAARFVASSLPAPMVTVAGSVRYYTGSDRRIPGVTVTAEPDGTNVVATSGDGSFQLMLPKGQSFTLTPSKSDDGTPSHGVTTLDLYAVRRHVLGIELLDSPYKVLAADVDGSGSVTTMDVVLMRRLILGVAANYPGPMWRFVRSDFQAADLQAPWDAESTRDVLNVPGDLPAQDFIGIKLGDVNGSWTAGAATAASDVGGGRGRRAEVGVRRVGGSGGRGATAVELRIYFSFISITPFQPSGSGDFFSSSILAR